MRRFDVVLWGCTGFTGRLVAEYFATTVARRAPHVKWALAGRNADKVAIVKAHVVSLATGQGLKCDPDILLGSADDQASVDAVCAQTRVILSTAGPFLRYGTPLVDACVRHRCDYVDTTGETPWVRSIMNTYDERARTAGVFVVPMCGFDSIPSDLGTYFTTRLMWNLHRQRTRRVVNYATVKGNMSGGTIASSGEMSATPDLDAMKDNPFLLGGVRAGGARPEDADVQEAEYDEAAGTWTAPFMMGRLNTRVVRRSAELFDADPTRAYGDAFLYREVAAAPNEAVAKKMASQLKIPQSVIARMVRAGQLPKPGDGPSAEERAKNFFEMSFVGTGEHGAKVKVKVTGGDPGYSETAKMVSEAALCLALQKDVLLPARPGGVLTPAAAFGHVLLANLHAAGIRFSVVSADAAPSSRL